jgi:predicted Fe-Mo cluster-binding NifX family protein
MNVCVPTLDPNGLQAKLSDHFGSAPWFIFVDLPSRTFEAVENGNRSHAHGQCNPIAAFDGRNPVALVCHGIGQGAITKLGGMGIQILRAPVTTVAEALDMFESGACASLTSEDACTSHKGC